MPNSTRARSGGGELRWKAHFSAKAATVVDTIIRIVAPLLQLKYVLRHGRARTHAATVLRQRMTLSAGTDSTPFRLLLAGVGAVKEQNPARQ